MHVDLVLAGSRLNTLKHYKWKVIASIEAELAKRNQFNQREELTHLKHRLLRTIPEYTNASYYEELYNQSILLQESKKHFSDEAHFRAVDDLLMYMKWLFQETAKKTNY